MANFLIEYKGNNLKRFNKLFKIMIPYENKCFSLLSEEDGHQIIRSQEIKWYTATSDLKNLASYLVDDEEIKMSYEIEDFDEDGNYYKGERLITNKGVKIIKGIKQGAVDLEENGMEDVIAKNHKSVIPYNHAIYPSFDNIKEAFPLALKKGQSVGTHLY